MKASSCLLLSVHLLLAVALKIPFEKRGVKSFVGQLPAHSTTSLLATSDSNASGLGNVGNIRYTTNVTINGIEVYVALDTGSTDLWVIPPGGIGKFNDTKIPLNLLYGDGTYGVRGTIGVSPFEFGPFKVEKQAFLNAEESTIGAMTELGIYGLFGLGFDSPDASPINSAIHDAYGPSATWGASVLKNIFAQNASEPNFIAVDLARTDDLEATAGGSFNIGEYEADYATIAGSPKILQYPENATRWTALLDGLDVDGAAVPLQSTIQGVPSNKVVALFDTGNPQGLFTTEITKGIYSKIDGAVYDDALSAWIVPCTATVSVEVLLGGQKFPIHPLDLSELTYATISGTNYSVCTNSFASIDNYAPDFDVVFGDTFLRNVYGVYDFGDSSEVTGSTNGVPYMQFLSQIDPTKAAAELVAVRTKAIAAIGPELPPKDLLALLNSDDSSPTVTSEAPTASGGLDANKGVVNLASDNESDASSQISRWAPIVVGLLAANLIVGVVLMILGVLNCVRRGGRSTLPTTQAPLYAPVKFKDDHSGVPTLGYRDADATYDTPYSKS